MPNADGALCLLDGATLWGAVWLTGSGWCMATYRAPLYPTPTSLRERCHGMAAGKREAMRKVELIDGGALPGA